MRCNSPYGPTTNDLVRRVVTTTSGVKPVIFAAHQRPDEVLAALKAGACGFLHQDISGECLVKSLELIEHSQLVIYPQLAAESREWKETRALEANTRDAELSQHKASSGGRLGIVTEFESQA